MKSIDRSRLFRDAWRLFRKLGISFSEALRMAWAKAKATAENKRRAEAAQQNAGVFEECHSWAGWKSLGREVRHGERCVFQVPVIDPERKTGSRVKSYFALSQTDALVA